MAFFFVFACVFSVLTARRFTCLYFELAPEILLDSKCLYEIRDVTPVFVQWIQNIRNPQIRNHSIENFQN